jgi:hypothetical protein
MVGTVGHFLLTARWMARVAPGPRSLDERWFQTALAGVGTLSVLIHVVALTGGLSLARGLAALTLWHAGLAVALGRLARDTGAAVDPVPRGSTVVDRVLEGGAVAILAAISLNWILNASASARVAGTDAAHYHVPVAANLALGARLFDLPATQHLYPMASSALAAWFILPLGGPLLVELTMLLPFLLLAASIAWIFRLTTGASGLAWTTWLLLALFSTPLFRAASVMSADLLFAAAFAALTAQLVALAVARAWRPIDVLLAGLALGLLVGSKTTGVAAAALLVVCWAAALPIVRWHERSEPSGPRRLWQFGWTLLGMVVLSLGAGGLWLLRNWLLFGSPIAPMGLHILGVEIFAGLPFEPSTNRSVFGNQEANPAYALAARAAYYTRARLGSWYLVALLPAVLVPLDFLASRLRRIPDVTATAKLLTWGLVLINTAALAWLLIGAPWSSLERSQGGSLRYLLSSAALLPCLALAALFPSSVPWYRRASAAAVAGVAAAAGGIALFIAGQGGGLNPPRLTLATCAVGLLVWLVAEWRGNWFARPRGAGVLLALLLVLSGAWAGWTNERGRVLSARAARDQARADRSPTEARAVYISALAVEQSAGRSCAARRFFTIVRFDTPLDLQSVEYRNQVFYAGRDVGVTARARPLTPCDYIIASRSLLRSDKGIALVGVLSRAGPTSELADVGRFVLVGRR